ncbi:MAG: SLAC1 anion channel family protein [Desulfotalea sp.]
MSTHSRLKEFPVSFFSIVMGLSGLTIAWEKTVTICDLPYLIHYPFLILTIAVFSFISFCYILKIIRYKEAVGNELKHPIKLSFFPTISISCLLLSVALLHIVPQIAKFLWIIGTILHFTLLLFVLNSWVNHAHFKIQHLNPAWFIPAVGNVLVPIAGTTFGYYEISWFFFSVGILFWLLLLTIIFNRILFHDPLPAKLEPTLFILIAPPAIGFLSYIKLHQGIDDFAKILYYLGLFFTFFLLTQVPRLLKIPFFLSAWAYSFPMAAITISSWVMFENTGFPLFKILALIFLGMLTFIVVLLSVKTIQAIINKKICLPE